MSEAQKSSSEQDEETNIIQKNGHCSPSLKKIKIEDFQLHTNIDMENPEDMFAVSQEVAEMDENFFEVLHNMNVIIDWELPKLHSLCKDVARHPNTAVREKILQLGLPNKIGHFSSDEDKIILQNWKELCSKYEIPDRPDVFCRWRNNSNNVQFNRARREAVLWLSKGLPERTPVQVYRRFINTSGSQSKGKFSNEEKELVNQFIVHNKSLNGTFPQEFLGSILGRDKYSVWRHLQIEKRNNTASTKPKQIKWDLPQTQEFLRVLNAVINKKKSSKTVTKENLDNLRTKKITWKHWIKSSKQLGKTPLQLKVYWKSKLYVLLFAEKPIFLSDIRLRLLKLLKVRKLHHWQDIDWKELASYFDNNLTSLFLWNKFYNFVRRYCIDYVPGDIKGTVNYLYDTFIMREHKLVNKRLQRLKVDLDGTLSFRKEEYNYKDDDNEND